MHENSEHKIQIIPEGENFRDFLEFAPNAKYENSGNLGNQPKFTRLL